MSTLTCRSVGGWRIARRTRGHHAEALSLVFPSRSRRVLDPRKRLYFQPPLKLSFIMGLRFKDLPFVPGNRSRVFPFWGPNVRQECQPCGLTSTWQARPTFEATWAAPGSSRLITLASHLNHGISYPGWFFSFCLIVVSLLDRFSTAFPFNS